MFDGQRLAIKSEDAGPSTRPPRKRVGIKRVNSEKQPAKPTGSAVSSLFGAR